MAGTTQRDIDEVEAAMVLARAEEDWRPVPMDTMAVMLDDAHKREVYEGAKDTFWDMYADQLVAPCTVFTAIALLQRCFLIPGVKPSLITALPPACLWVAVKVAEGQDAGGLLSAAIMCHEWNQFSAHTLVVNDLLSAEHDALLLLQVNVMQPTSFDTFVLCLRLSGWAEARRRAVYQQALERLILIEGRSETLSYSTAQMAAALCMYLGVPLPPSLCSSPLGRAVQYLQSFDMVE